jgi:hypothetical protein
VKFSIISHYSLSNVGTWFFITICLLGTGIDVRQSRRARTICSSLFHRRIILTIGRHPFIGSAGLGQLGLAASRSLISKPASVMSKQIRCLSQVSALASSVQYRFGTLLMLARSVGFCPNGFKNPPLNLYPFPRFVFLVVVPALLFRLPFLLSSGRYFLHHHHFFFFYFESLLWAS